MEPNIKKSLPYLSATGMSLIFGFSFLFSKNALESLDPFQLLFLRFLLAFCVMSLLIWLRIIQINFKGKNIKPLFLVAILEPVIYFIMETFGLKYATTCEAGVMMAFSPVLVAVLGIIILNEKLNKQQTVSIALSFSGVIMLVLLGGKGETGGELKGIIFMLGAVFTGSFYSVYSRKASSFFTPYEITYFMMCAGTVFFGLLALAGGLINGTLSSLFAINSRALIALLYLGTLCSIGAYFLINYTLSKIPASQSAIFTNLIAIISVMSGIVFRNETFELYKLVGAVLVMTGVFGTNYFGRPKSCLNKNWRDGIYDHYNHT